MVELPEASLAVVRALVRAPLAWQTPDDLATALSWNVEQTTDQLALLDAGGWIEVWERDTGPVVTLSPLGAERLGVRLTESGPDQTLQWGDLGDPEPFPPRAKHVFTTDRAARIDFLPDPSLPPDLAAEESEVSGNHLRQAQSERRRRRPRDELPRPTLLLGQNLSPWPGPRQIRDAICPVCAGLKLAPFMYCLYCDRWGLDALIRTVITPAQGLLPPRPPRPMDKTSRHEAELKAQREARIRRRARRRARLTATSEVEQMRSHRNGTANHGDSPLAGPGPPAVS